MIKITRRVSNKSITLGAYAFLDSSCELAITEDRLLMNINIYSGHGDVAKPRIIL